MLFLIIYTPITLLYIYLMSVEAYKGDGHRDEKSNFNFYFVIKIAIDIILCEKTIEIQDKGDWIIGIWLALFIMNFFITGYAVIGLFKNVKEICFKLNGEITNELLKEFNELNFIEKIFVHNVMDAENIKKLFLFDKLNKKCSINNGKKIVKINKI